MKVAFYAPLKAPDHPNPSGDRLIARTFIDALRHAGHELSLSSTLRAWDGKGDPGRQAEIQQAAQLEARRLTSKYTKSGPPDCWFTYHLFHKAPDWIGPVICNEFSIPYVVAEASFAPKQHNGPWASGHAQVARCLDSANGVVTLNPVDLECVLPKLRSGTRLVSLKASVDTTLWRPSADPDAARERLATRYALDSQMPWLIAVAMMRKGDKQASFAMLADALVNLETQPWQLLLVGDGNAQSKIRDYFARFDASRIRFPGRLDAAAIADILPACDLCVWPAINEALGMALLEAQACGVPVVAGRSGGVDTIVLDGQTGSLVTGTSPVEFASAVGTLLGQPNIRRQMGNAARDNVIREHSIASAALSLDALLQRVCVQ